MRGRVLQVLIEGNMLELSLLYLVYFVVATTAERAVDDPRYRNRMLFFCLASAFAVIAYFPWLAVLPAQLSDVAVNWKVFGGQSVYAHLQDFGHRHIGEYYKHYYMVYVQVAFISIVPGALGLILTRAWRKRRFLLYVILYPLVPFIPIDFKAQLGIFFGYLFISTVIFILIEIPLMLSEKGKALGLAQFCSLILCIPLLDYYLRVFFNSVFGS
jgi:hypothetical protein